MSLGLISSGEQAGLFQFNRARSTRVAIMQATLAELDLIEELRLRRWARENYCPVDLREQEWHPVVLDEMRSKDQDEQSAAD